MVSEQRSVHRMSRQRLRNAHRFALGTAQFGLKYGVANHSGQVSIGEISAILACALDAGMDSIDTAMAYGQSEENLGQSGVNRWKVITKLPPVPKKVADVEKWVSEAIANSLIRLRVSCLEGLLLHQASDMCGPKGEQLHNAMLALKRQGIVRKIGVSIYNPEELETLIGKRQIDLVQAPFSVVDRRILTSGWMKRLHELGIELHVRSIFLQGLLLSDKLQQDPRFCKWNTLWDTWFSWLKEERLSPLQACLGFVLGHPEINRIVVGVDKKNQLTEILGASQIGKLSLPDCLVSSDLELIHPSRWISVK
jgi:aryl-alcohol dehydrogenase-like predicted oxidoreductase